MDMNFKESLEKILNDKTKIFLGEAIETIIGSMLVINQKSLVFQGMKNIDPKEYDEAFDIIINTLLYNFLYLAGYEEDEIMEIGKNLGAGAIKINDKFDA